MCVCCGPATRPLHSICHTSCGCPALEACVTCSAGEWPRGITCLLHDMRCVSTRERPAAEVPHSHSHVHCISIRPSVCAVFNSVSGPCLQTDVCGVGPTSHAHASHLFCISILTHTRRRNGRSANDQYHRYLCVCVCVCVCASVLSAGE
jgi:hypothetical protein